MNILLYTPLKGDCNCRVEARWAKIVRSDIYHILHIYRFYSKEQNFKYLEKLNFRKIFASLVCTTLKKGSKLILFYHCLYYILWCEVMILYGLKSKDFFSIILKFGLLNLPLYSLTSTYTSFQIVLLKDKPAWTRSHNILRS